MQVAITPATPAEARLVAAFFQDYADLLDVQLGAPAPQAPAPHQPAPLDQLTPEQVGKPRRTRKSAPAAEAPVASGSSETAAPADPAAENEAAPEAGNEAAPDATAPAASTEAPDGSATAENEAGQPAAAAAVVDISELRTMFGKLTQDGKRDAAIAVVRKCRKADGAVCNGLADIQESDRAAVLSAFKEL